MNVFRGQNLLWNCTMRVCDLNIFIALMCPAYCRWQLWCSSEARSRQGRSLRDSYAQKPEQIWRMLKRYVIQTKICSINHSSFTWLYWVSFFMCKATDNKCMNKAWFSSSHSYVLFLQSYVKFFPLSGEFCKLTYMYMHYLPILLTLNFFL